MTHRGRRDSLRGTTPVFPLQMETLILPQHLLTAKNLNAAKTPSAYLHRSAAELTGENSHCHAENALSRRRFLSFAHKRHMLAGLSAPDHRHYNIEKYSSIQNYTFQLLFCTTIFLLFKNEKFTLQHRKTHSTPPLLPMPQEITAPKRPHAAWSTSSLAVRRPAAVTGATQAA